MMRRIAILVASAVFGFYPGGPGVAAEQTFESPTIRGYRLDHCQNWGQQCGAPAADLFCKEKGFDKSTSHAVAPDIGAQFPTLVFGDGRLCDGPDCDGFRFIVCEKGGAQADAAEGPMVGPMISGGIRLILPSGAALYRCASGDCSLTNSADIDVDPAADKVIRLQYDVSKLSAATGARWQLSSNPYPIFDGGSARDKAPVGLVATDAVPGNKAAIEIDLEKAAQTFSAPVYYVRALPVGEDGSVIVGQPTNVMRIYYAAAAPQQTPYQIYPDQVTRTAGPQITLTDFSYSAQVLLRDWPDGCKQIPRDTGTDAMDVIGGAVSKTWNFASKTYAAAKKVTVDVVDAATLGVVPRGAWEVALDGALVAAGIPPDIPNLDAMMSGGVDYLAGEAARQAMAQIPAANLAPSLGNLAADITLAQAQSMGEDALRARLEKELSKHSRDAILAGADAARDQVAKSAKDIFCRNRLINPSYVATVRNTGQEDARDVQLTLSDTASVFHAKTVRFSLAMGEAISIPIVPDANVRNVQKSQLVNKDRIANEAHWRNEIYPKTATKLLVTATGDHVCRQSPGQAAPSCYHEARPLFQSSHAVTLNGDRAFR